MATLNPFVYEACAAGSLRKPNFDVLLAPQFSQCGEDLIVVALIRGYCARRGLSEADQTYCEIGANHPIATSSTYLLHQRLGMRGVLVEANAALLDELRSVRPYDEIVHAAITDSDVEKVTLTVSRASEVSSLDERYVEVWKSVGGGGVAERVEVPAMHISALMKKHFAETAPVYLSIDVEGQDLALLQGLPWQTCRPYIVQAEPSEYYLPGNTERIVSLMRDAGYVLLAQTDVNMIFVDASKLVQ